MPLNLQDVQQMATRYAKAWSSYTPGGVAAFFEEDGRISINDGESLVGRPAIAGMVRDLYTEFPDLLVHVDDVRVAGHNAIFLWTLEGHHSETGKRVRIGGWEEWTLSSSMLVSISHGRFDVAEYECQIAEGA